MRSLRWVLFALLPLVVPVSASGQFTLVDQVDSYASFLGRIDHALVQLQLASEGGVVVLNRSVVADLRRMGVRRVIDAKTADIDASTASYIRSECFARDWYPRDEGTSNWAMLVEVRYWSRVRSAETTLFQVLLQGTRGRDNYTTDTYVERCADYLSDILIRLGFDEG